MSSQINKGAEAQATANNVDRLGPNKIQITLDKKGEICHLFEVSLDEKFTNRDMTRFDMIQWKRRDRNRKGLPFFGVAISVTFKSLRVQNLSYVIHDTHVIGDSGLKREKNFARQKNLGRQTLSTPTPSNNSEFFDDLQSLKTAHEVISIWHSTSVVGRKLKNVPKTN